MANRFISNLTTTWNNVATVFAAIKMNVTDTASAASSKLIDLQISSVSKFSVDKAGNVVATGTITGAPGAISSTTVTATGNVVAGAAVVPDADNGATLGTVSLQWTALHMASGSTFNWNNGDIIWTHSSNLLTMTGGSMAIGSISGASLTITDTDATAVAGPLLYLDRFSATPAVNDLLGHYYFRGRNASAATVDYAVIYTRSAAVTAGTEEGVIYFGTRSAGSMTSRMNVSSAGLSVTDPITLGSNSGIKFPASANLSVDANTLDDYQEDMSWTPSITPSSGTFTSVATSGRWLKIGRCVYWEAAIVITTLGTAAGYISITLPVTADTNSYSCSGFNFTGAFAIGGATFSTTQMRLWKYDGTFPGTSGQTLIFGGKYFTDQ